MLLQSSDSTAISDVDGTSSIVDVSEVDSLTLRLVRWMPLLAFGTMMSMLLQVLLMTSKGTAIVVKRKIMMT